MTKIVRRPVGFRVGNDIVGLLKEHEIEISMDGKDAWRSNVFVERFWRLIKYEEVYLRAYESASEVKAREYNE